MKDLCGQVCVDVVQQRVSSDPVVDLAAWEEGEVALEGRLVGRKGLGGAAGFAVSVCPKFLSPSRRYDPTEGVQGLEEPGQGQELPIEDLEGRAELQLRPLDRLEDGHLVELARWPDLSR